MARTAIPSRPKSQRARIVRELRRSDALALAIAMMNEEADLEPTSALKEAARHYGIEYGPDMESFVAWALPRLAK